MIREVGFWLVVLLVVLTGVAVFGAGTYGWLTGVDREHYTWGWFLFVGLIVTGGGLSAAGARVGLTTGL